MDKETGPAKEAPSAYAAGYERARLVDEEVLGLLRGGERSRRGELST